MDIDPYKFLGVTKTFTPDQLKAAYKKLALTMHPDKEGGNQYMFNILTDCYKQLAREYNRRISDRQFNELKTESQAYSKEPPPKYNSQPEKSFNIDKFNSVFDKNKIPDGTRDTGYEDWLKNTEDEAEKKLKFKGKFTNTSFNEQFEKNTPQLESKHLIKYKEPEPMLTSKKIQYTELGVDLDDFSGDNTSRKNLNFMDLKLAHTTNRIVDPKTVNDRKIYKTVGDVEADRSTVKYHMTEEEQKEYEQKKYLEEMKEEQRIKNLNKYDTYAQLQFEKVNRLMLGGPSGPSGPSTSASAAGPSPSHSRKAAANAAANATHITYRT